MLPDIVRKIESLSFRSQKLSASLRQGNLDEIEKEIVSLKDEHRDLSAQVFAQQEITSCINLLATQLNCLSPSLTVGLSTKAALFDNSFSEIKRVLQSCETELIFRKALYLLGLKCYQEALCHCEYVLTKAPWHERTRSLLNIVTEFDPPLMGKKETISQKFQFNYLHSFGQQILCQPHNLHVSNDGTTLFVSDQGDNSVHRFNIDGEYLGRCTITPTTPRGLFSDENNKVWVCDMEGQRLICMNQQGEQQTEIYLPDYAENECKTTYPCWGTHSNGMTTLILTDHQEQSFVCRNIFPLDLGQKGDNFPIDAIDCPCGVVCHENILWVGSKTQGCLYTTAVTGEQFEPLHTGFSHQLKSYALGQKAIFFNLGNTLIKTTISGEVIFSVDLTEYLERLIDLNLGLSIAEQNGKEILYAPDGVNKCIHAFSV